MLVGRVMERKRDAKYTASVKHCQCKALPAIFLEHQNGTRLHGVVIMLVSGSVGKEKRREVHRRCEALSVQGSANHFA